MKNKLMSNKAVKITLMLIALALIFTIGFTQEESVFAASSMTDAQVAETLAKSLAGEISGVGGINAYNINNNDYSSENKAKFTVKYLAEYMMDNAMYDSSLSAEVVSKCNVEIIFVEESFVARENGDSSVAVNGEIKYNVKVTYNGQSYTAGESTQTYSAYDPTVKNFEVSTGQEFMDALSQTASKTTINIELQDDIVLTEDMWTYSYFLAYFYGGTIDGNGHKITFELSATKYLFYYTYETVTLTDIDLEFSTGAAPILILGNQSVCNFNNVTVLDYDPNEIIEVGNNFSAYIAHNCGVLYMKDCTNNEQYSSSLYAGLFVGGYSNGYYTSTIDTDSITFENCVNSETGALYGQNVSMFFGNTSRSSYLADDAITIINCENKGIIQGTATASALIEGVNGGSGTYTYYSKVNGDVEYVYDSIDTDKIIGVSSVEGFTDSGTIRVIDYSISGEILDNGKITLIDNDTSEYQATSYRISLRCYSYSASGQGTLLVVPSIKFEDLEDCPTMLTGTLILQEDFDVLYPDAEIIDAPWIAYDDSKSVDEYKISIQNGKCYYIYNSITSGIDDLTFGANGRTVTVYIEAYDDENHILASKALDANSSVSVGEIVALNGNSFYSSLQEAITFAEAGDTIAICDDITISEQIKIAKDVTIISADGKNCTITSNVYNSFSIAEGINFNLDSLNFVINNNLIWANKENDIKITNCTFEMTTGGYIIGSGNSQDATEIATEYSDLIFTGNTVTGAINKLFIIRPNGTTTISGNTITAGEGSAEKSTIGAIVGYTGASINITNNTITGLYRVVCIDNTTETVSWNISSNKFIDCDNVLNYDSEKDANAISIAYNFNGETADSAGTLGGLMDEQEIADESVITRYPYYADSALTTLVYEGGEEKSNEDVVADLDATTDLETAVETLVSIDSTTLASSSEMIDKVNEVDTAFVSENENISSEAKIAETDLEEEAIQSAEVSGLALSALGGTDVLESTTVYIEITQQDASEEDADIVLSIKPYVQVGDGDATLIENSSLDTPVTITIELPAGFDSSYVNIQHISDDCTITNYDNLKVVSGKVTFTVTHFSTFNITKVETTSSSSSSSNITISSEYTGGNTYSAEEETVEPEEDTSEETIAPTVTETPVATEKPSTAETANTSNGYIAWIIIAVLAIAIVGFIIYKKKANK